MEKINKTYLQSEITQSIINFIDENKLKSGDRLPSQQEMVTLLGVSRTSLREAMKTMEAQNYIEVINGKGIFVKDREAQSSQPNIEFRKQKELYLEIFELRLAIEAEIIRLVVENATEKELEEIQKVLDIINFKYQQGILHIPEDKDFHYLLYKSCHNKLMLDVINFIEKAIQIIWENPLGIGDFLATTTPMHSEMFNYIIKRDVKRAQKENEKTLNYIIHHIKNIHK